jgi:hypothetical protein
MAVALLFAGLPTCVVRADIIYDNTSTSYTGSTSFSAEPQGDEVQAGGTARFVTQLQIGVYSQMVAETADVQAFLYANDGSGGAPGTLLWQSPVKPVHLTGSPNDLVRFAVPAVQVPGEFTWAAQISNTPVLAAGLPIFGQPTVGTYVAGWFGGPGQWTHFPLTVPYLAQITARAAAPVPEPATLGLAACGLVAAGAARIARRRRAAEVRD